MRSFPRSTLLVCTLLFVSHPIQAAVLGVTGNAFLHGVASDNDTNQTFGTYNTSGVAFNLTPGGTSSYAASGGTSNGEASIGGTLGINVTGNSVSATGSLTSSASHTGADPYVATYANGMAGVSDMVINLGGPGVAFTLSYAFHHEFEVSGAGYSWMYYSANIGTSSNAFHFSSANGSVNSSNPAAPTLITGLINGITDSNGDVRIFLDLQPAGSTNAAWWTPYSVQATTWWEFDLTTGATATNDVPVGGTLGLLLPALIGIARRRGIQRRAC